MHNIKEMEGFSVGGVNINNLRYSDDIIADSEQKLQNLMDVIVDESGNKGLDINKEKSYVMVFSKKAENPNCSIRVKGDVLKQNQEFQYLGKLGHIRWEIRQRNKAPDWDSKDSLQGNGKGLSITQHQVCNKTASFKVLCVVSTAVWIGKLDNQQGHAGTTLSSWDVVPEEEASDTLGGQGNKWGSVGPSWNTQTADENYCH